MGVRLTAAAVALLVLWTAQLRATVTCSTSDFASAANTIEMPTLGITVPASANAVTVLVVHDRTESATIDSVADSGTGETWTLRDGPDNHSGTTIRSWIYQRTAGSTGAITITVDFSAAVNNHLSAGSCTSDVGALTFDQAATTAEFTTATSHTSNAISLPGAGVMMGFLTTNNNVSVSAVGSGEVNATNATARAHIITQAIGSAGSHTLEATTASASSLFSALSFTEPAGGGGTRQRIASPPPPAGGVE